MHLPSELEPLLTSDAPPVGAAAPARGGLRERRARVALLGLGVTALSAIASFGAPRAGHRSAWLGAVLLPLLLLGLGLGLQADRSPRARALASWLLLGGLPIGLAITTPLAAGVQPDPIVFWLEAACLLAFMLEAARLAAGRERPLSPISIGEPSERARLRRREGIYRRLLWVAGLAFVLPLAQAVSSGAGSPRLAVAVAGLLAALACRAFLVDPLERHLQHDPALVQSLAQLRRRARRGRPGLAFYAAASVALAGMVALVSRQVLGVEWGSP